MNSLQSLNQKIRSLDLRLKNENDSNLRCSFEILMLDNPEFCINSKITNINLSQSLNTNNNGNNISGPANNLNVPGNVKSRSINSGQFESSAESRPAKRNASIDMGQTSIENIFSTPMIDNNLSQIKSTCSNFIEKISARLNSSFSNKNGVKNIILNKTFNTQRPVSNKINPSSDANLVNKSLNMPSTVNAQCLSPRPRPRALPTSLTDNKVQTPSKTFKPLLFEKLKDNNLSIKDKFKQNNNIITLNGQEYKCTENDFKYIEELGSGSCGHVVKMEHLKSNAIIAVKQMRRSSDIEENKRIIMDLDVLLKCHDFNNIVQCYGYLIKDTEVWIFMELMSTCFDKMLKTYKKPFPEKICGKIAVASIKSLNYLKEHHSVMHRDVKPSNILINEKGIIKLCDFGISGRLVDSKAKTRQAGCIAYLSPERIEPPDPNKPSYDIRADVWSLGITLVELAMGTFPYTQCNTDFEILTKIIQSDPPLLPDDNGFSEDFCNFIKQCLQKDYRLRPKYKELINHPFIKKYDREEVDVQSWFLDFVSEKN